MAVETYTKSGAKATTPAKLDKAIFGVKSSNHQLLKDAYLAHLANNRGNFAKSLKRGEVRGGGQKPWRQKGTGRARFGSSRNPIWTGGGVAFGPTGNENYTRKLSTKAKHTALKQALSIAAEENRIKIIDSIDFSAGKVKPTIQLLNKINADGSTIMVIDQKDPMSMRSTNNLASVKLIHAQYLTVFDILNANCIIITKKALEQIQTWLGGEDE